MLLIVFFAAYASMDLLIPNYKFLMETRKLGHRPHDLFQPDEERFNRVRGFLLPGEIVGYVFCRKTADKQYGLDEGRYFLAQFAVAPVILHRSKSHRLILVEHLESETPDESISCTENISDLKLIEDFGRGIQLYVGEGAE